MTLSRSDKARLLFGLSLVAPILTVQGMRFTLDGSAVAAPASASADTAAAQTGAPSADVAAMLAPPKPLTAAQIRAAEFLATRDVPADLASPMDHPTMAEPAVEVPAESNAATPEESPKPAPRTEDPDPAASLTLTSIFVDSTMSRATISGTLRKVGDEVALGWTITDIDGKRRVVTLRSKSGRTAELTPNR